MFVELWNALVSTCPFPGTFGVTDPECSVLDSRYFEGSCYKVLSMARTWSDAETDCASHVVADGHLASVPNHRVQGESVVDGADALHTFQYPRRFFWSHFSEFSETKQPGQQPNSKWVRSHSQGTFLSCTRLSH